VQCGGNLELLADGAPDRFRGVAASEGLVDRRAEQGDSVVGGDRPRVPRPETQLHPLPEIAQPHQNSVIGVRPSSPLGQDRGMSAVADPRTPARPADDPDRWYAMQCLTGPTVRLAPLQTEHAAGYLAAAQADGGAAEVFRWMLSGAPDTIAAAEAHVHQALAARARGERLPYAQFDVATGEVIGSTSLYEVNPAVRALAIGYTWLGRRWWRTGHNSEAKLLLLTHAFQTLGAVRVVWHTDIHNERSQRAIERLGATREGLLRQHRIRPDGSWRDTVQYSMTDGDWPQARQRLTERLGRDR